MSIKFFQKKKNFESHDSGATVFFVDQNNMKKEVFFSERVEAELFAQAVRDRNRFAEVKTV